MTDEKFPPELKKFLQDHFDSIELLEVLLFLRQHRDRTHDAVSVSSELRSAPESVAKRLRDLELRKLLVREGSTERFRYHPQTEKLERLVSELAEAYREKRFSVINLIFSKPATALKDFADAFKLKKDDTDGST